MGPGATNLVNGVANAFLERAPLLVISAQVATSMAPSSRISGSTWRRLFRPITKWSHTLTGTDTAATVQRALDLTVEGRPGPVYLALPGDVARMEEPAAATRSDPYQTLPADAPTSADVDRAARMIAEARTPLAVVGIGLDPIASAAQPPPLARRRPDPRRGHPQGEGPRPGGSPALRGHLHRHGGRPPLLQLGPGGRPPDRNRVRSHRGDPPLLSGTPLPLRGRVRRGRAGLRPGAGAGR